MRSRLLVLMAGAVVVLSACSSGTPTQAPGGQTQGPGGGGGGTATATPDGGGGGGGTPTDAPAATPGSAGGGGTKPAGWDKWGTAHFEVGGPQQVTGDLGFVPAASHFGGTDATILYFTVEGSNQVLALTWSAGSFVAVLSSEAISLPAAECTTSNVTLDATSGSGSFDCKNATVVLGSGLSTQGGTLKGNFSAHG